MVQNCHPFWPAAGDPTLLQRMALDGPTPFLRTAPVRLRNRWLYAEIGDHMMDVDAMGGTKAPDEIKKAALTMTPFDELWLNVRRHGSHNDTHVYEELKPLLMHHTGFKNREKTNRGTPKTEKNNLELEILKQEN